MRMDEREGGGLYIFGGYGGSQDILGRSLESFMWVTAVR